MAKYTFVEFLAAYESDNFDKVDESTLSWAKNFLKSYENVWGEIHEGDCTNQTHTCSLCLLQTCLEDYKQYTFDEVNWRDENKHLFNFED